MEFAVGLPKADANSADIGLRLPAFTLNPLNDMISGSSFCGTGRIRSLLDASTS
jgi:hypothetical protein